MGAPAGAAGSPAGTPQRDILGTYGQGWRLAVADATTLRLGHDQHWTRLGVLPDGRLVGLDGPWVARRVGVAPGQDGVPLLEVEGYPAVPWLVGPAAP